MAGVTLKLFEQPTQGEYFDYIETPPNKVALGPASRPVVPGLGWKRRAVDLRSAARREPLHNGVHRLRRLQRPDGHQWHHHRRAGADGGAGSQLTGRRSTTTS